MNMVRKRTFVIVLCVVSVLGAAVYRCDRAAQSMMDHKVGRPATATVVGKESPRQHDSHSDWEVYYRIDMESFRGPLGSEVWNSIIATEKERYDRGEYRSAIKSKRWYDRTRVGDKLDVNYRWVAGGEIEILNVGNPRFDDQR